MNCGYHWVLGYKTLQTCSHIHTTHLQNAFLETISITTLHFHYKQSSRKCKQWVIRKQALHVLASFPGGGRRESLISTACACVQFAMKFHGSWMLLCNIYVMMMSTLWFHCFLQGYSLSIPLLTASSTLDAKQWLSDHSRERLWDLYTRERTFSWGWPLVLASQYATKFYTLHVWCDAVLCYLSIAWMQKFTKSSAALSRLPNHLMHFTQACFGNWKTIIFNYSNTSSSSVNREASFCFAAEQLKREAACLVGITAQHTWYKHAAQDAISTVRHVRHCTHPQKIFNVIMVHTHITPPGCWL